MATISDLTSQLEALKKARGSGALVVKHGDTQVTYRSIAELNAAIASVTKELNQANGIVRRPRYVRQTGKGY